MPEPTRPRLGPQPGDAERLAAHDGLQIYLPCLDAAGLVPVETAAALFALRAAGVPAGWLRPVVWRRPPAGAGPAVRVLLPGAAVTEERLPAAVAACRLPAAHLPAERLCVAGLCAVVRRGVRAVDRLRRPDAGHYCHRDDGLLGFRRGTLAPPAEASLWTRFCERDVPAALRRVLAAVADDGSGAGEADSRAVGAGSADVESDPADGSPGPGDVSLDAGDLGSGSANVISGLASVSLDTADVSPDRTEVIPEPGDVITGPDTTNRDAAASSLGQETATPEEIAVSTHPGAWQPFEVPAELLQFEHHMQQPLRVHNVWKQEQASGGRARHWKSGDHRTELQCVRHTYAEGHVLTISDLLLYPCLRLLLEALRPHGLRPETAAPACHRWLRDVAAVDGLVAAWDAVFPAPRPRPAGVRRALRLPQVPAQSLYKKDPARYKPKNRLFTVQADVAAALARLREAGFACRLAAHPGSGRLRLDWAALPAAASPAEGGLPASRLARKQHQLENVAWLAARLARPGDTVVDFCSGGGHLGLLLAVLLPRCHVVLVENKEESLRRAQDRAAALALANVSLYQCNMEFYRGRFQLGVALHACGVATDLVMERCLTARAALVCCPCCYGAVQNFGPVAYPRSAAGRRTGASPRDWLVLGHAADQTHADQTAKSEQGRLCMAHVDSDRAAYLAEAGYRTLLTVAEPADCSNKNHLLAAVPPHWDEVGFLADPAPPATEQQTERIVADPEQGLEP